MKIQNKPLQVAWDYVVMSVGTFLYVIGWTSFMIPNSITSGGLTGLCTIIQFATEGAVPVGWTFPAINAVLIILASLIVGKGFGFRTIYVIILSTLLFDVMPQFQQIQCIPGQPLYISEKILVPVIGSIIEGTGIAMILAKGGSTGGSDILAVVINKFWPVSLGKVYVLFDLVVITSIALLPGKTFQDVVYGYIAMITFSLIVDYVLLGRRSTVQILIFSDRYEEIADYIIKVMDRGVTALNAVGWYTRSDRKVLLVMVRKFQLHEVTKAVKSVDPHAFMAVSPASGVYGEGFEEIKTGIERKKKKD